MSQISFRRLPILAVGMFTLVAGILGGLLRLGLPIPAQGAYQLAEYHGPLMVCGFLGVVIGLERAVAFGKIPGYLPPVITGLGGLSILFNISITGGQLLILFGSLGLVAVYGAILRIQSSMATGVMGIGAALWAAGNLLWLDGHPLSIAALFWAGFLILTIAGERLELSRMRLPEGFVNVLFVAATSVLLLGLLVSVFTPAAGVKIAGAGMIGTALWLMRFDIARNTVKMTGLTRFVAVCVLTGYFWLALGGALALAAPEWPAGFLYDAVLHCVFLGFVFGMIFGHAPIIFPAILNVAVPYSPVFYFHLALMQASLAARIAGDMLESPGWLTLGGAANAAAVGLFLINTIMAVTRGRSTQSRPDR
ncbi:MAG: hypothetical protein HY751_06085 [Nitrospinae bacterium]|nr:hypothetical protein [Nitrospinota bacterium]